MDENEKLERILEDAQAPCVREDSHRARLKAELLARRRVELVPWWRRRVSVPVPALAALIVLFIVIQVMQSRHAPRSMESPDQPVHILEIALVQAPVQRPFDLTRTRQPFLTNPVISQTTLGK